MMFAEISKVRELRKRYNHKMFMSGNPIFREYEELEAKVLTSGVLERKYKEMTGIAISIISGCYGCIEYHTTAALENGATKAEIAEITALAICMGGGTVQWASRYVFDVMDQIEKEQNK